MNLKNKYMENNWEVTVENSGKDVFIKKKDSCDRAIAKVYNQDFTTIENASLLASAPLLLGALKRINTHWSNGNFSRDVKIWKEICDAIKASGGEEPVVYEDIMSYSAEDAKKTKEDFSNHNELKDVLLAIKQDSKEGELKYYSSLSSKTLSALTERGFDTFRHPMETPNTHIPQRFLYYTFKW